MRGRDVPDGIVEINVVCAGRKAECEVGEDLSGGGGVEFGLLVCEAGELAFQSTDISIAADTYRQTSRF